MSSEEKNNIREQHTGGIKIGTSRFKSLLESTLGDVKPLVNEQAETKVAGPIGLPPTQYYIYNKGGKFYIYQTNATQKTPILMQGAQWNNNGPGYDTQDKAEEIVQKYLPNKPSYSDVDTETEPPIEVNEEDMDDMKADSLIDMEEIIYDIKTTDCEGSSLGNMSSMGVDEDEDGNIVVFIRYCKGDDEELEYLKRKARREIVSNYGLGNIIENDLGLPHPNKTVYKKLFNSKLSEAISEVGTDSEAIYDSLCLKLDDIMENWRYESGDGGKSVWGDNEN
jgi:hypothetical protein